MKLLNSQAEYGLVSRSLHWIVVVGLVLQWRLAEADEDAGSIAGFDVTTLHQSIGLTILLLAIARLIWRFFNPKPAWPTDMKAYEIRLARVAHAGLYVLLFALPLTGWALASVEDEPLRFFNWFDVPRVAIAGEDTLEEVHETLFNILVVIALFHVLGAAKHWLLAKLRHRNTLTA